MAMTLRRSFSFTRILTSISSRLTLSSGFSSLISRTSTSFASCFLICSRIISSLQYRTTVILVYRGSAVTPAVIVSILYPRRLKRPATLLKSPGVLSTSRDNVLFCSINTSFLPSARRRGFSAISYNFQRLIQYISNLLPLCQQKFYQIILFGKNLLSFSLRAFKKGILFFPLAHPAIIRKNAICFFLHIRELCINGRC